MLELCRCPNIYGPDCIYIYIYIYIYINIHNIYMYVYIYIYIYIYTAFFVIYSIYRCWSYN